MSGCEWRQFKQVFESLSLCKMFELVIFNSLFKKVRHETQKVAKGSISTPPIMLVPSFKLAYKLKFFVYNQLVRRDKTSNYFTK